MAVAVAGTQNGTIVSVAVMQLWPWIQLQEDHNGKSHIRRGYMGTMVGEAFQSVGESSSKKIDGGRNPYTIWLDLIPFIRYQMLFLTKSL